MHALWKTRLELEPTGLASQDACSPRLGMHETPVGQKRGRVQASTGKASLCIEIMRFLLQPPPLLVSCIKTCTQSDSVLLGPYGPKLSFSKRQKKPTEIYEILRGRCVCAGL